jgi:hypothetical protein
MKKIQCLELYLYSPLPSPSASTAWCLGSLSIMSWSV